MSIKMKAEKTTANSNGIRKIADSTADARSWLENLSVEECTAALSFQDGPFLVSFLELAAASVASPSSTTNQQPNLIEALKLDFAINDALTMSVDEKEWKERLSRKREELCEGKKESVVIASPSSDTGTKGEDEKKSRERLHDLSVAETLVEQNDKLAVQNGGKGDAAKELTTNTTKSGEDSTGGVKEEADVFRIRSEETASAHATTTKSIGKAPSPMADIASDVTTEAKSGDAGLEGAFAKSVKEISENICVVTPTPESAAAMPFVAIHPNYLKHKGTGEFVLSLDKVIQKFSPDSQFLPPDLFPEEFLKDDKAEGDVAIEQICLRRLHSLMASASGNNASVMLFLALLVRIEVAAYMAYVARPNGKPTADLSLADTTARLNKHELERLMKPLDVLEKQTQTLDQSSLNTIVEPLTEAGYCCLSGVDKSSPAVKLQNLLFTPLPALVKLFSSVEASNNPAFQRWNKAWTSTIGNLLHMSEPTLPAPAASPHTPDTTSSPKLPNQPTTPAPPNTSVTLVSSINDEAITPTTKGAPTQSDTPDGIDDNTPSAATSTPSSNAKKKKKRRNKKKNKKNSNGINNGNTADTSSPNTNQRTPAPTATKDREKDQKPVATPSSREVDDQKGLSSVNTESSPAEVSEAKSPGTKAKSANADDGDKPDAPSSKEEAVGTSTIAPAETSEAAVLELHPSASGETASMKSESTKPNDTKEDSKPPSKPTDKNDFTVSRVHGVGTVVVAPSTNADPSQAAKAERVAEGTPKGESAPADDNLDEWETVEVKGRGNRKRSGRGNGQHQSLPNQTGQKKSKAARTSASRKRVAHRKIVKDILSTVLDSVDEEVRKRRQHEARAARNAPTPTPTAVTSAWKEGSRTPGITFGKKKETTLRDVVMGKKTATAPKRTPQTAAKEDAKTNTKSPAAPSGRANQRNGAVSPVKGTGSPVKGTKSQAMGADQNTATTIPETVSAVSDPKRAAPRSERDITRSDSSSADTEENQKQEERAVTQAHTDKTRPPEPPLPTLLNPGNVNSASSSVASSLEAPHASHGHHHTSTSNEVDVGYHLLDVCDRLTRDMDVFMGRRASALSTRRRERGALLGALQDSVSSIWGCHSHVELYGSCATMLDLPSSDLDVVVCGLEQMDAPISAASSPREGIPSFARGASESVSPEKMSPDSQLRHSVPHFVPVHLNQERVVRLAAELERHPWAVHVKAIPTASVPVVKILADPSRLPGSVPPSALEGEEWMLQQHPMGSQDAASATSEATSPSPTKDTGIIEPESSPSNATPYQSAMAPVWRGADVINGLLQVDITFEGPEHGGIGSTEFSARVVQNVCEETGLPAEGTAFVQVMMVVKELLAQRRLNEPFSGGLSSYALLLLVLSVMCERKVVRAELDRVERQRRVVAAGGGNSEVPVSPCQVDDPVESQKQATEPRTMSDLGTSSTTKKSNAPSRKSDGKTTAQQGVTQAKKDTMKQAAKSQAQPEKRNQGTQPRGGNIAGNQLRGAGGNQQQRGNNAGGNQPRGANPNKANQQDPNKDGNARSSEKKPVKKAGNSWASIAMGKNNAPALKASTAGKKQEPEKTAQPSKPSSFADAVARSNAATMKSKAVAPPNPTKSNAVGPASAKTTNGSASRAQGESNASRKTEGQEQKIKAASQKASKKAADVTSTSSAIKDKKIDGSVPYKAAARVAKENEERKIEADEKTSKFNNYSSEPVESAISSTQSAFPQGFNDVIEVLCSGETTPGKLLMHVLLFYGQHFDAHATAIDISGKHHRDISSQSPPYPHLSPYIQRRSAGNIDPVTGMLTVDPIVVYDPLEGAENNNVARRCFLWSSVKWVFAQSYMTLASAAERNTTPPGTPGAGAKNSATSAKNTGDNKSNEQGEGDGAEIVAWTGPYNPTDKGSLFDPSSPLLELLLSF